VLEFQSIRWKNFLSTGDKFTEIYLNRSPTTLILGDNGAGKSTVLDALTFGLFGKPFRKINKPQLPNTVNEKDCLIEIEFVLGKTKYMIRRGIKPAIFEIYHNNKMINQDSKIKDYQKYLEDTILKLNFKSFTQTVILGSATFVPFMQLSAKDRRDIIEDLLDIKIFSSMNDILKTRIADHKESLLTNNTHRNIIDNKIHLHESSMEEIKKDRKKLIESAKNKILEYDRNIESNENQIEKINDQIVSLTVSATNLPQLQKKISKMDGIKSGLMSKIKILKQDQEFFQDIDNCPTCKQDVDCSHKDMMISEKNHKEQEIANALGDFDIEYATISSDVSKMISIQSDIASLSSDVSAMASHNRGLRSSIKDCEVQIEDLENSDTSTVKMKRDLKKIIDEKSMIEATREELLSEREYLNVAASLLKDGGIKTSIAKYYLPIMNGLINKYLHQMDFYVNFTMDENFSENIKSRNRENFSYSSFSEGEKMRIDLALLFTWREIAKMKNSVNTNLLILDEVFDSSLDSNGTDEFLKLLNELGGNNVFVISHKGEILYDKFRSIIKFDKVKNFSKIVEEK
jgi:DNA repair exonuclease SbcCD ATPase subunit